MTDEQIIKALECCATDDGDNCSQCPYGNIVYKSGNGGCVNRCRKDALDLINCQKIENEELQERISYLEESIDCSRKEYNNLLQKSQQAKSEAIKEFAERLKEKLANLSVRTKTHGRKTTPNYVDDITNQILHDVVPQDIDKLVKEMTEV